MPPGAEKSHTLYYSMDGERYKKSLEAAASRLFSDMPGRLFWLDSLLRADAGAGTAVHAFVSVDGVDIAFGDGAHGAFTDAGTATDTFFRINFMSHNK